MIIDDIITYNVRRKIPLPSVAELTPPIPGGVPAKIPGWNGDHPIFRRVIEQVKPDVVVEVGCWHGHGSIHLAGLFDGHLYCVDTWLGGFDHLYHWDKEDCHIPRKDGYPWLYFSWLHNIASFPYAHRVHPMPMTSLTGAHVLSNNGVKAGVIVIDASHQYLDVFADLQHYGEILTAGGAMICDDFRSHEGVFHAVLRYKHEHHFNLEEVGPFAVLTRK